MDFTVCKLPLHNNNTLITLKVEWGYDKLNVTIFHMNTVWSGKVTTEEIKTFSHRLSMNNEEYMCETRQALSTHGGANKFTYAIEDEKFFWKQLVDNDADLKIKFGYVCLEEMPCFEMLDCLLDTVISNNHQLISQVKALEHEKLQLESGRQELLNKLVQYQHDKTEMEETLYSNFLDILNAKKKRIRMLEKHIDQSTGGASKSVKGTAKGIICESDSEIDDRKSEEDNIVDTKALRLPMIAGKSSRMILDDSDDDKSVPKALPRRKVRTKRSKTKNIPTNNTSKKKEKDTETMPFGFPDLSSHQPSTSGHSSHVKVEEVNHYDSDTDVDQCTDDENHFNMVPSKVTKSMDMCIENLFDDIKKPAPTCTLPKRMRRQAAPELSETSNSATQIVPPVNIKSSKTMTDKLFNAQDLLDELIN